MLQIRRDINSRVLMIQNLIGLFRSNDSYFIFNVCNSHVECDDYGEETLLSTEVLTILEFQNQLQSQNHIGIAVQHFCTLTSCIAF